MMNFFISIICFTFFRASTCSSTIKQNGTYIQNPSYPSKYTVSTTTACSYSITPSSTGKKYCFQTLAKSVILTFHIFRHLSDSSGFRNI